MAKIKEKNKIAKNKGYTNIQKKQIAKYKTTEIGIILQRNNPNSKLEKAYKDSIFCMNTWRGNENNTAQTFYCKRKWCFICERIKMGRLISWYQKQIEEMQDKQFVTLTLQTVKGAELKNQIELMEKKLRDIYVLSKKTKYVKILKPLKGIVKREITIRPSDKYHFHFHLIIEGKKEAEWVKEQWLRMNPEKANKKAQKIVEVQNESWLELFKYAVKAEIKIDDNLYAKRLDFVFNTLHNKRMYSTWGGIKAIKEEWEIEDLKNGMEMEHGEVFTWKRGGINDWINKHTAEMLSGIRIPEEEMIQNKRVITTEI